MKTWSITNISRKKRLNFQFQHKPVYLKLQSPKAVLKEKKQVVVLPPSTKLTKKGNKQAELESRRIRSRQSRLPVLTAETRAFTAIAIARTLIHALYSFPSPLYSIRITIIKGYKGWLIYIYIHRSTCSLDECAGFKDIVCRLSWSASRISPSIDAAR